MTYSVGKRPGDRRSLVCGGLTPMAAMELCLSMNLYTVYDENNRVIFPTPDVLDKMSKLVVEGIHEGQ